METIKEIIKIIAIIWLPLGIIGYILTKEAYKALDNGWPKIDRNIHLFSIVTGVAIFIWGVLMSASSIKDEEEI